MWPFLPLSLFPPGLGRDLFRPRQSRVEDSCGGPDLGSQVYSGQRRERGGWGEWGSGVGMGLNSSSKVPGASCTEDVPSVVRWAGAHIHTRGPSAKFTSPGPSSSGRPVGCAEDGGGQ